VGEAVTDRERIMAAAAHLIAMIGNIANRPDIREVQKKQVQAILKLCQAEREAGWNEAIETAARVFESGDEYNEQTFYGPDNDDQVMLTFRVMAIIAHRLRALKRKEEGRDGC
jgi:hypothetical protein